MLRNSKSNNIERVMRIGRYLVEKPQTECLFRWQLWGEFEAFSAARRSVSDGVVVRVGHCLTVWAKSQTPLRASCMSQSDRSWRMTWALSAGRTCTLTQHRRCAWSTGGTGQGDTRWHAEPVDTRNVQLREVRHEEGGKSSEPC